MKNISTFFLLFSCLLGFSQQDLPQKSIVGMLEMTQGQIEALAQAFDESQFNWRPAEGIRSTGETVVHVAAANYYLGMKLGFPPPEGVDIMTMEKTITGKEAILEAYQKSAEFIRGKMMEVDPASLGSEVDLGFMKTNRLSALLVVLEHTGEHKGQLIAYARSNGVVPPWSQQQ
ncbi:MAG: DinB family protein [Robiginitalea sp.]